MDNRLPLEDLVARVLVELDRLQYSSNTQAGYRRLYQRMLACAHAHGIRYYSEDFGRQFFETTFQCAMRDLPQPVPRKFRPALRHLRCLGDYQLHGTLLRRQIQKTPYEPPPAFKAVLEAFARECDRRGYSPLAARTRWNRLRAFVDYLATLGVAPEGISSQHLSNYTATLIGYHAKTVAATLTTIRTFLRFLYYAGYHAQDLSGAVPRLRSGHYERLPSIWPADAVQRLLVAVDRGNPTGKRDYAILLLAARLGMRVGDIKALMLSALQWDTKTIVCVQQKTGRPVTYPLLDDVGWALIDYLQHGRPLTASPYVFVRHSAPFEPFGKHVNLHHIITTYTRRAGIPVPRGPHGMHSLRHTLASALLEQHTPLPVIADILGHLSTQSTQVYLHVDLDALRRCALDPEEVFACVDRA